MRCSLIAFCVALLFISPTAWAQTSGNNDADTIGDKQPAENVRGGAVHQRAPGRVIDFARARHMALRDARLAAQRSGDTSALAPEPLAVSGSGDWLSNLLGSLSPSLINSFLNTGLGGSGGSGSTGSTGDDFSNLPPEVIQMLAGAGIDLKDLNQKSNQESADTPFAQPKESSRMQTSGETQQERDFVVRWADAMLSTIFTSLAVAVQTNEFIDLIKDIFRPLINPGDTGDSSNGTSSGRGIGQPRFACVVVGNHHLLI